MLTSLIAIIKQNDIRSEAVQKTYLMYRKCRTTISYDILNTTLVHRDNVRISLHHINKVVLSNSFLCLEDTIEFSLFMIDNAIGRIDILLINALCTRIQQTTTKGSHLTAHTHPWEHHTSIETVDKFSILTLEAKTCLYKKISLETCL